MTCTSIT